MKKILFIVMFFGLFTQANAQVKGKYYPTSKVSVVDVTVYTRFSATAIDNNNKLHYVYFINNNNPILYDVPVYEGAKKEDGTLIKLPKYNDKNIFPQKIFKNPDNNTSSKVYILGYVGKSYAYASVAQTMKAMVLLSYDVNTKEASIEYVVDIKKLTELTDKKISLVKRNYFYDEKNYTLTLLLEFEDKKSDKFFHNCYHLSLEGEKAEEVFVKENIFVTEKNVSASINNILPISPIEVYVSLNISEKNNKVQKGFLLTENEVKETRFSFPELEGYTSFQYGFTSSETHIFLIGFYIKEKKVDDKNYGDRGYKMLYQKINIASMEVEEENIFDFNDVTFNTPNDASRGASDEFNDVEVGSFAYFEYSEENDELLVATQKKQMFIDGSTKYYPSYSIYMYSIKNGKLQWATYIPKRFYYGTPSSANDYFFLHNGKVYVLFNNFNVKEKNPYYLPKTKVYLAEIDKASGEIMNVYGMDITKKNMVANVSTARFFNNKLYTVFYKGFKTMATIIDLD